MPEPMVSLTQRTQAISYLLARHLCLERVQGLVDGSQTAIVEHERSL